MAATVDFTSPASLEARRKTSTSDSPLMSDPDSSPEKIGCGLAALPFKSTQTVLKPHYVVGGKLTTTTTVDLTAAPDPRIPSSTIDCTGKRLLALEVFAAADNAAVVNVTQGASNPYLALGSGNDIDIAPGERFLKDVRPNGTAAPSPRQAAVASDAKTLTFTLGAGDECLWCAVLGD